MTRPRPRRTGVAAASLLAFGLAVGAARPGTATAASDAATRAPFAAPVVVRAATIHAAADTVDAAVRGAIDARLDERPPAALPDRAWRRAAALYAANDGAPYWITDDGVGPRARALVAALAAAHEHGLRRTDYALDELALALEALAGTSAPTPDALARADVALTSAFAAYADDMLTGRTSPRAVEPSWHIDANVVDVDSAMRRTLRAERIDDALARLAPTEAGYATLVAARAEYDALARRGNWPRVPESPVLRPGDSSAVVVTLRARLAAEGFLPARAAPGTPDTTSRYDGDLVAALADFQARHGLAVDSVLGPRTRAALNVPAARRARQIAANLERYRWLPPDLGDRYVLVNVPAFRLHAYEGGREVLTMPVVVGRELADRRTPVFSDSMSYVQFGPYWNVPRSIAVEEILPKARADRGHLARNDYEIVRGWGDDAPVVDPYRLSDGALFSSRYRVRQRPGPGNALGRVKFMFPNDFAVYLHDTPAQSLFDERVRAYSHGCVRVADPAALAQFVLGARPAWDASRIRTTLAEGRRVRVDLERKIPVYLIYLTAFDRDGRVAFRDDLYDRDDGLLRLLAEREEPAGTASLVERLERAVRSGE